MKPTTTTMHKQSNGKDDETTADNDSNEDDTSDDVNMESSTTKHYRHITLSRGLSKYGPWGYLILGMLLCGGALLVCVLWGKDHFQYFPIHFICIIRYNHSKMNSNIPNYMYHYVPNMFDSAMFNIYWFEKTAQVRKSRLLTHLSSLLKPI